MGGKLQVPSDPWLMLGVCNLGVWRVLHEELLMPVMLYGGEMRH